MRTFFCLYSFLILLFACNDGDVIISQIDFENNTLELCGDSGEYVFYKINPINQETLALKLKTTDAILNTEATRTYALNQTTHNVTYRVFNQAITSSYFCNTIPPSSPLFIKNYESTAGSAIVNGKITDTLITFTGKEKDTSYVYTITLQLVNLVLEGNNEIITLQVLDMGSINFTSQ